VALAALAANGELARLADLAHLGLRDFSEATAKDCSSSTASVRRDLKTLAERNGSKSTWGNDTNKETLVVALLMLETGVDFLLVINCR
jgi:hypothetical protein